MKVPIEDTLEDFKVEEWDKPKVLELFKELNFNRYIDRFSLRGEEKVKEEPKDLFQIVDQSKEEVISLIEEQKQMIFLLHTSEDGKPEKIIKEKIVGLTVFYENKQEAVYLAIQEEQDMQAFQTIFENETIQKISIDLTKSYILLKQAGID